MTSTTCDLSQSRVKNGFMLWVQRIPFQAESCAKQAFPAAVWILLFIAAVPSIFFAVFGLAMEQVVGTSAWEPFVSLPGNIFLPLAKASAALTIIVAILFAIASFGYVSRSKAERCQTPLPTYISTWAHRRGSSIASTWISDLQSDASSLFAITRLLIAFSHRVVRLTGAWLAGNSPLLIYL